MSLPPHNSGANGPNKPPAGKPGPLPMSGPQTPPGKPLVAATPPVRKASGGSSVLTIVFCAIGGIALVLLLICGGIGWWGYNKVQQARRKLVEVQAQAHVDHNFTAPPPSLPQHFPSEQPIDSIPRALAALDEAHHFRREEAANYLASQPVDAAQREAVMTKGLALLGDWSRREQARRIVEKWVAPGDAPQLLAEAQAAAQRNDRDTQRLMMQLLAKTGDERAVDAAAQYLATGHDQQAARQVLVAFGPTNGAKLLPLANHPNPGVRQTARDLLVQFAVDETSLAKQCVADLNSSENERKREAARWLAQHLIVDETLSPQVSAALMQQLSAREVRSDMAAALALWATADDVPKLVEAAHAAHVAQDRDAQREVVQLLAKLKDKRGLPALAEYMNAGHDRFAAKNAFATFGPEAAETVMQFANHSDFSVQHFARQLLAEWEIAPAAYVGQSVKDLASGDLNRQRGVVNWLAQQPVDPAQQAAVSKALEPLLDDENLRRETVRALKVWATSDNVPKLLTLLSSEDRFFRSEVLQVLVALRDPRAVSHIAAGFTEDFSTRHEAARHLRAMGPMAESALWPHTTSNDWQTAMEACNVLKDIGTKRSLPALQLATQHANPSVKFAAQSAIKEVEAAKRTVDPMSEVAVATTTMPARGMREWKDATGKNKIQAEFVEFASGRVKLKTREGRTLSLNISQLSAEDRRYVIEQMKAP